MSKSIASTRILNGLATHRRAAVQTLMLARRARPVDQRPPFRRFAAIARHTEISLKRLILVKVIQAQDGGIPMGRRPRGPRRFAEGRI
jgi:hypothetical protein